MKEQLARVAVAPGPWVLAALFAAFSAAFFAIFGFLPTLLTDQFGLSQNLASAVAAICVAASGLGNLVAGVFLSAGRRPVHVLTAGFVAMIVFGFGVLAIGLAWPVIAGLAVLFSFMAGLVPVALTLSAKDRGKVHAAVMRFIAPTASDGDLQQMLLSVVAGPATNTVLSALSKASLNRRGLSVVCRRNAVAPGMAVATSEPRC